MTDFLNTIDYTVITIYAIALIVLAFYLQRKASSSIEDYLVGSRQMPWWMLGFSGMAAFLDVAGTMLIVSFLFMIGPRGLFVEFRGGAVLVLIPIMLWTGKWHRRSRSLTGAEWMVFRFGNGFDGRFAQLAKAISGIVITLGMLAYLIKGIGLFLSTFMPYSPFECALGLVIIATIYTMMSGFYGVVVTDLFQSVIILLAVGIVTVLALGQYESTEQLTEVAARVTGNQQWTNPLPSWHTEMPPGYDAYEGLIVLSIIYTLRNLFFGLGAGDDPKYFAAKSDEECSKFSLLWTCLMAFRWPMMMGFAILGLFLVDRLFPDPNMIAKASTLIRETTMVDEADWATVTSELINKNTVELQPLRDQLSQMLGEDWQTKLPLVGYHGVANPERIMPMVLISEIPTGLRGLMLVALIAASMSTFDSEVNKTAGYFVRDIYQSYLRPQAKNFELISVTWIFIALLVVIGFLFAFTLKNVNDIWGWIIMGLGGGLMAPLILRMYWWRFNGTGFALGTLSGMIAAILQRIYLPDLSENYNLLILAAVGFTGAILGSFLAPPPSSETIENFYFKTLPFGFWKDLPERLPSELRNKVKAEHRRDVLAIPFAFVFQVGIFLSPMLFLVGETNYAMIGTVVSAVAFCGLYLIWFRYRHLSDELLAEVDAWLASTGANPSQSVSN